MTADFTADAPAADRALDRRASVLMKEGIRLLGQHNPDGASRALVCFDRALELRGRLPVATVPAFGHGLAACWLNRAEALMRLGGGERLRLAVHACDEAIALLSRLPLDDDARFRRRLAIAHQHRGLALQAIGARTGAAITAFTDSIVLLDDERAAAIGDRSFLLAVASMNLANAYVSDGRDAAPQPARTAARRALALVSDAETVDAEAAEVGIKARHVVCRAIAWRLSQPASEDAALPDDVHDATDAADEALDLVRLWERRGVSRFGDLALDLFRFGAGVYGRYQPQFLDEFLADNPDRG